MGDSRECHLVTGGGGYMGIRLGLALLDKGYRVILFDIAESKEDYPKEIKFIKGDVRDAETVTSAFEGVDCVYHLASYGMSGREQLNRNRIIEVNLTGTTNVINACKKQGVHRLVYTSTYNVVFGGQEIINGTEETCSEYFPVEKHPDFYSQTKSLAEQEILSENGYKSNGYRLHTCALRLAGVYGPGEQRHLPRVVKMIEAGLFAFTYGDPNSKVDFVHVDNLVQAHVKAGAALSQSKDCIAAGKAYFICDGKPVNNFEFFRPLVEGLGYKFPSMTLPISLIYFFAFITEMVHSVVGRVYNFQPMLTRAEVFKTGVTHYFSISRAERELGYKPTVQNDMESVLHWFKERGYGKRPKKSYTFSQFIKDAILAVLFAVVVMSFLPSVK